MISSKTIFFSQTTSISISPWHFIDPHFLFLSQTTLTQQYIYIACRIRICHNPRPIYSSDCSVYTLSPLCTLLATIWPQSHQSKPRMDIITFSTICHIGLDSHKKSSLSYKTVCNCFQSKCSTQTHITDVI